MKDDVFKFPSTPHLTTLECVEVRSDKVLSKAERLGFLQHEIFVEEKVDGANLGISFDTEGSLFLQNRGSHLNLPGAGQWKKLDQWLSPKMDVIFEADKRTLATVLALRNEARMHSVKRAPQWPR